MDISPRRPVKSKEACADLSLTCLRPASRVYRTRQRSSLHIQYLHSCGGLLSDQRKSSESLRRAHLGHSSATVTVMDPPFPLVRVICTFFPQFLPPA